MKKITWLMACLLWLLSAAAQQVERPAIRIAVIDAHIAAGEKAAIAKFLSKEKGWTFQFISLQALCASGDLNKFTHVWYHRTDTTAFDSSESMAGKYIRHFVRDGGQLFLSMEAVPLLNTWGIEEAGIQLATDSLIDEGFGRPAGFHAFKSHPLFHGMNGGVYITKQTKDHAVRKHGFFGNAVPIQGQVAGIQWTYITFTEQNKLLLEYHYGKGHIVAAGAYLYYDAHNYNQQHLEQFTRNVFRYTAGEYAGEACNYWNYSRRQWIKTDFEPGTVPLVKAADWHLPAATLQLQQQHAGKDFYDLVGRRILWMGKMNAGADEIWMHPFMALRDLQWAVKLRGQQQLHWLSTADAYVTVTPEYLIREYNIAGNSIREMYTVSFDQPNAVAHIETKGPDIESVTVKFASNLRYMWPYSDDATGSIRYGFSNALNGHIISGQNGNLNTVVAYSERPVEEEMRANDSLEQVEVSARFSMQNKQAFNMYIMGSSEGLDQALDLYRNSVHTMSNLAEKSGQYYRQLLNNHLYFETPDTLFNQGYLWALARTDQFLQTTPGLGTALMAGFGTTARGWNGNQKISGRPGYAWYFGRDGEWSAMAINDYGDYAMVKEVLETFIRYQDLNGKIYHELTSSGAAHYDAADATPLFIILAAKYLRTSGDSAFIREHWSAIQKAIDFCYSTDTDGDGLIENTNVGHGWIEGGSLFGTHTEFYLAGCWASALESAAYMAGCLQLKEANRYFGDAGKVKQIIDGPFWNKGTQFFQNGKMKDGSYMTDATVLAAVPIYLDAVSDNGKASKVSARFGNKYFSSDWGLRIIEDSSKKYRPGSYHAGMVWPLYGGWASLAEYKTGYYGAGYRHIMNNLLPYRNWALGSIEETLNGDVYKPNGVCSHQAWSETMILQPAMEGMLGYSVNALENELQLSPAFPWQWEYCTVHNIRMRDTKYNLSMKREAGATSFSIQAGAATQLQFNPVFPLGTRIRSVSVNDQPIAFTTRAMAQGLQLQSSFGLKEGETRITIQTDGGIGMLPIVPDPQPGDSSRSLNIIAEQLRGNHYEAVVSGNAGNTYQCQLYSQKKIKRIKGAKLLKQEGQLLTLQVELGKANSKYPEMRIQIELQ